MATTHVMLLPAEHLGDNLGYPTAQHDLADLTRLVSGLNLLQAYLSQSVQCLAGHADAHRFHGFAALSADVVEPMAASLRAAGASGVSLRRTPQGSRPRPAGGQKVAASNHRARDPVPDVRSVLNGESMTPTRTQPPNGGEPADGGLSRITLNLTSRARVSIDALMAASGDNKTDAINAALRLAATLLAFIRPDGTVHIVAPDGTIHVVHLP